MERKIATIDGNEATANIAHRTNEVIAIYPITPSTPMGELADAWSAAEQKNIWGTTPLVIEMQAEGGAAGAVHGALQTGSLTTTFTASQGLLLMLPNMYKIAGELTSTVFHVAARSVAAQALSIFGDHSDVMGCRASGFAMLSSGSTQEAHDFALISQAATLKSRVPFMHFFEGFRVSHEIAKIEILADEDIRTMIDNELVYAHRQRGLSPDHPVIRGTAQNPDVFFQARETVNTYYDACPEIVQEMMDKFATQVGRQYKLFDYIGAPDAERVIVILGSGGKAVAETVKHLNAQGEKVGVVMVRLYRPFSVKHLLDVMPASVKVVATLDRTKEPGATGEPLYQDIITAFNEGLGDGTAPFATMPSVIGGRYGLSSKEFTPAMAKGVFDEMAKDAPKNHFTVGIVDDVTNTSVDYDADFSIEGENTIRALFFGLGSDGTVGANKNSIKIIGEETENFAQGHFVYDSRKAGAKTISHLRFGPDPINAPYEITKANFVACHQFNFLEQIDMLKFTMPGAVFLLNSTFSADEVWDQIPQEDQKTIVEKKLKFYVIDGYEVASKTGMGVRINTIMQTCFFAISGVLPKDDAIAAIKGAIKKTYSKRGEAVVQKNYAAVDQALAHLYEVEYPSEVTGKLTRRLPVPAESPEFVRDVLGKMITGDGNDLPVSAMPADGTYPSGTTQWEKRNLALDIPVWEEDLCIQCGKCVFVCPHAVIRQKVYEPALLDSAPETFKSLDAKFRELPDTKYTIQVAPEDCTACNLCVEVCPAKDKTNPERKALNMAPQPPIRESEKENWDFFLTIPEVDRTKIKLGNIKNSQLLQPLFEFSGACAGCGETPYIKLMTQLFGDRTIIANATGCSSIYGGNLPTTPYTHNSDGRGPAWSNSLFEDNAEFGLGMRLTVDKQSEYARELLVTLKDAIGQDLVDALLNADQTEEEGIQAQRARVEELKEKLAGSNDFKAKDLLSIADVLVTKSVWIVGGDGWAYDIGYGGLDHVLASGRNVNILVMDTQVYSNTGGQSSKATPIGAVAKFAAEGKEIARKDLGMIAMSYGYVYVAQIAMGASDMQTLRAFREADAFDGPSLIIAYSHCIAHGYDMKDGLSQQQLLVKSGLWPLYRYNPDNVANGKNPLKLDSKAPSIPVSEFAYNEARYRVLSQNDEPRAETLMKSAQKDAEARWKLYKQMADMNYEKSEE
ncbi:MAG: pyruvate:ferredoxin (flavodoxin) oxidoreductase [Anaerolineae bacterium]|jgi:pyruvate-ferredoxin/flavodoxin oxidoreductase|nr:pyruvate:ferredoxin (flavodoxin) oxidoreductase [Anaerolineae bacterium]MBT7191775.1 pyruvate:ferredoxin (flavodoxin) oxidoreductase [Anaerolineae bacterium]MBT7989109.1 pyruvate:ferredoxin (flavodoxin) oxidoreductase [Anaerolineae bacterium]